MEEQLVRVLSARPGLQEIRKLHALAIILGFARGNFVAVKLILASSAAAAVSYSEAIFNQALSPSTFLFNAIIRAFTHNGLHFRALSVYKSMISTSTPDFFTLPFALRSSTALILPLVGRQLHAQSFKLCLQSVPAVANSLQQMYSVCELSVGSARRMFDEMPRKDVVSWTAMISAYASRGGLREASYLFAAMPERTTVAWTALISGHAATGEHAAALHVFRLMLLSDHKPDDVTVLSILPSCSCLGALGTGRWIHAFAGRNGFLKERKICNALVEMYGACGSIEEAGQLFDGMPRRDVISWTAMISGLARHGRAEEAVKLFDSMKNSGETSPNGVTLLAVLSACAHAGMIDKGLEIFSSMDVADLRIEHYGCAVDLLCRGGRIRCALKMIEEMPMKADAGIWGSLLCACRRYGDAEVATLAAERLQEMEPESAGNSVAVTNLSAMVGEWEVVRRLRNSMRSMRMSKTPGCSSIEVENSVKEFVAGLNSGGEFSEIDDVLRTLYFQIMDDGSDFSPS